MQDIKLIHALRILLDFCKALKTFAFSSCFFMLFKNLLTSDARTNDAILQRKVFGIILYSNCFPKPGAATEKNLHCNDGKYTNNKPEEIPENNNMDITDLEPNERMKKKMNHDCTSKHHSTS